MIYAYKHRIYGGRNYMSAFKKYKILDMNETIEISMVNFFEKIKKVGTLVALYIK